MFSELELLDDDLHRCFRKSDLKARIVLALYPDVEVYASMLGELARSDSTSVLWALYGRPPFYSVERSLVGLGLVDARERPMGTTFRLTERGRWAASSASFVRSAKLGSLTLARRPPGP